MKGPKILLDAIELGFFLNFETGFHAKLAEMICNAIPSAEKVRLSNTGTEATMGALRLARYYTGKDEVIRFEGNIHVMHDYIFYDDDFDYWNILRTILTRQINPAE